MEEKFITLIGDNEEEILAEILFTFEHEQDNFVLLTIVNEISEEDEDYGVLAYKYEEKEEGTIGNLIEIPENSSDWEVVEEMFNTFMDSEFRNE